MPRAAKISVHLCFTFEHEKAVQQLSNAAKVDREVDDA
jgi:hypothetical protein